MNETGIGAFNIRPVEASDIESVIQVHRKALPEDYCSLLGREFLSSIYYPELMRVQDHLGLCAVDANNRIVGFVFFLKDKDFLRKAFFKHFLKLVRFGGRRILDGQFLTQSISLFAIIFLRSRKECENDYELNYIAVDPACQGIGIGTKLIEQGLQQLVQRGSAVCWVKTLDTSTEAVKFYEANGFKVYDRKLGRIYLCRSTEKNDGV